MMSSTGILASLREGTREQHRALEGSLNLMDDELTLADYVRTLQRFHGFVCRWEATAVLVCPDQFRSFFEPRWRIPRITEDLQYFGAEPLLEAPELPDISTPAAFWGSMYVMEGSTLGGVWISRHLEKVLDLRDGMGYSYFRGYGAETGAMWKDFCNTLSREAEPLDSDQIVSAACETFQSFHRWLEQR